MSRKIFAANWKLNKSPEQSREFLIQLKNEAFKSSGFYEKCELIFFPQAFSLEAVATLCAGTQIGYGPQNVYWEKSGAFTGENSAEVALQLKSQFALVGHSERREIFKESNEDVNKKNLYLHALQMTPVFCVGETLTQREQGQTLAVCFNQIDAGLKNCDRHKRLILAYEPVWAIGTGKVATIEQVADVHQSLNKRLTELGFQNFQILYGGSVKPDNASDLLNVPFVDGFLIGGASLEVTSFLKICLAHFSR